MPADSSYSVKFSFRTQNLFVADATTDDLEGIDSRFAIRRARLKFDGFAYSPKLVYKIELGLTNNDIGPAISQGNNASNVVLDAVIKWKFAKRTALWFGQTKLPGNRERVISSQALQFVDRSNLNGEYNIDRDLGVQLRNEFKIGKMVIRDIYSISMGEGRNITTGNKGGYDYTARLEFLPFGNFTKKGDYVNAAIYREETPKLSLAVTYDYNDDASREKGQLGKFLPTTSDLSTIFADLMFKYKGISVMAEYADRQGDRPVSYDEDSTIAGRYMVGQGINIQAGYMFKNNLELAGRYTAIYPEASTGKNANYMYTFAVSRYIVGHSLKVQTDFSLLDEEFVEEHEVMFRFQVELAF